MLVLEICKFGRVANRSFALCPRQGQIRAFCTQGRFFSIQGQVTLRQVVQYGQSSNLSQIPVMDTCKFEEFGIKTEGATAWTKFLNKSAPKLYVVHSPSH